jgi:hypothetical protein
VNTSTSRITSMDSPNRSKLALAVVSALALVMALLTPAIPANATGSGSITSVVPTSGPAGTTVTITGDVGGVDQVLFGSQAGTSLSVAVNGQSLSVVSPTQPSGSSPYLIKLVDTGVGSVTLNSAYSYRTTSLPQVTSVSPASGSAAGYTAVTISGSNFTGATAVRFGTTRTPAVSFSVFSDSRIVAYVPEGTAGATVRVYVTNASGETTSVANYKYKTSTCSAGTYLRTKFGSLSSTLTKKQKRDIREAADDFVSLGCEQVNLVKYIGVRAGSSATYKAYLTLQNKRANAVSLVLEKRLATWGVPIIVNEVKRATQKSQARKASPDSLVKYRNVLLSVPSSNGIEVVYPNAGPTTGGTVVITGKGFTNVAETGAVKFGSTASPSYTVNATGTKITATVPAGVAGNTNVTVQTGVAGTSTAKLYSRGYTYVAAPTITSLGTNTSGSILGGTSVTITGTNFIGVTAVKFGQTSNAVSFTVNSATSITAVTPPGVVGPVNATVVAAGGSISGPSFTYVSPPEIVSISPAGGAPAGATSVTITGTNFVGVTGAASVKFGSTNATSYVVNSPTSITAVAPAGTGLVDVKVLNSIGEAIFTNAYAYTSTPTISAISPTFGALGGTTSVTITGTNFLNVTGAEGVKFGATNATSYVVNSSTQITAVAPAGTGQVNVTVTNPLGVSTSTATYTYSVPTIASLSPTFGAPGGTTSVTITGTNFLGVTGAASVKFGATNATSYVVNSATSITAVAPAGTGQVNVKVTNAAGESTSTATYTYSVPTITSLSPTSGVAAGGTSVTITGTNFLGVAGAAGVKFGATNATSYVVNSATSITAVAPAGTTGDVNVTVTNPAGESTSTATYTYN